MTVDAMQFFSIGILIMFAVFYFLPRYIRWRKKHF